MATHSQASSPDMPITIKVVFPDKDENRKFKLPLRDLGANSLPDKLRTLLAISSHQDTVFERYSDSSSSFITLDSSVPSVYKQLHRAAKAKQKLKIRVTVTDKPVPKPTETPKPGPALPERLSTRCYVHPYISDPSKTESESVPLEWLPTLEQLRHNPSSTTLVPPVKASSEQPGDIVQDNVQEAQKLFCWPISEKAGFSDATKALFEMKIAGTAEKKENIVEKDTEEEAPVPQSWSDRQFFANHATMTQKLDMIHNAKGRNFSIPGAAFTICCNKCDKAIPDAHWHCGICDRGDFDLCGDCVEKGTLCENEDHFLIKRFVKDGKVIASTTETIAPKKAPAKVETEEKVPGAFTAELKRDESRERLDLSRTCNCCVGVFEEPNFVTCTMCEDYDLCIPCHVGLKHGHHPSHTFEPASKDTVLDSLAVTLCAPGRNMRHWAICDGCDKDIYGVRHKCMNCPDWDYCSECVKTAHKNHPGHRFVPLYEPISQKPRIQQHHSGIFCDGPLCVEKNSYITGVRYKCAVCHDTDFCASCEALPKLSHNRTHPLIKFKTPVRNVAVTTIGENMNGEAKCTMGDRDQFPHTSSKSTETTPAAPSANAATQVQTVAEVKPAETVKEEPKEDSKLEAARRLQRQALMRQQAQEQQVLIQRQQEQQQYVLMQRQQDQQRQDAQEKVNAAARAAVSELQAHFMRDTVVDGSSMPPRKQFEQTWTLRNPGPNAWPVGCCVCFIGGDGMLNVDLSHPSHVTDLYNATRSNVIDRVVDVGEEVDFTVVMRTPEREGKAISYWRLKDASGMPFGHKLWCDVDVREPAVKVEEQAKSEHVEDISKHAKVEDELKDEESQHESKMIFPKLDKESPVSSYHEAEAPAPIAPAPISAEDKELLEDVESLELDEDSESDDAFLTDEEYELIATDDEIETARNGKK